MSAPDLTDVPETALWTLRNRAEEALRDDSTFEDPLAVELYRAIDADFEKFGPLSQSHPLRALAFDTEIRAFLGDHPHGPVVALGEGLQTTYWRLGLTDVDWFSVDLPPMVAAQTELLPPSPGITRIARSALDRGWFDAVPHGPAFISAEGLFMYLPVDEVEALIIDLAARFPGGRLVFDSIPRWFSALTMRDRVRLSNRYVAPRMPSSLTVSRAARLPRRLRGVASARDVMLGRGRGAWGSTPMRLLAQAPLVREIRPTITVLDFDR